MGRWLLPLLIAATLSQSTLNLARPLVSYRVISLGGGAVEVGVVAACFAILPFVLAMPLGRVGDRPHRLAPMLSAGIALFVASAAVLSVANSVATLALGSAVLGTAQVATLVAGQGTVARWAPPHHMDRGFAWFTAATSLGQLLGPLATGFLLGSGSAESLAAASQEAFLVAAAVSLAALPFALVVALRTRPRPAERSGDSRPENPSALFLLRRPQVPTWLFSSLALLGAVDILTAYLPLIGEHRGIAPSIIGVLLALRAGATICSRLILHRLLQRWGHTALVVASAIGSAAAIAIVPLPGMTAGLMAAALLVGGFFLGFGQPLTIGLVVRAVPPQWRSSGLALRLMANRVGQATLPAIAGLLAGPGGGGALWLISGVLFTAAGASHRAAGRQ